MVNLDTDSSLMINCIPFGICHLEKEPKSVQIHFVLYFFFALAAHFLWWHYLVSRLLFWRLFCCFFLIFDLEICPLENTQFFFYFRQIPIQQQQQQKMHCFKMRKTTVKNWIQLSFLLLLLMRADQYTHVYFLNIAHTKVKAFSSILIHVVLVYMLRYTLTCTCVCLLVVC